MHESLIAVLLGIIQGLTEFLPVSSSGHLRLAGAAFGLGEPDTLFDIAVHAGTLGAVCAVYRADLGKMVGSLINPTWKNPSFRLVVLVCIGTVPVGCVGIMAGDWLETNATDVLVVGGLLILNGVILMVSRGRGENGRTLEELTVVDALVVGAMQSIALFRGISRSGTTITTALLRGVNRSAAATFGFLLAIPAIAGATVLQLAKAMEAGAVSWVPLIVGTVTAAAVGYLALLGLIKVVNRGQLHHFAWYCWALGLTAIAVSVIG